MLSNNSIQFKTSENHSCYFPSNYSIRNVDISNEQLEQAVVRFVRKLGIRPNLIGYHLLIKAIILCFNSPVLLNSLTKGLYPALANECGKNVKSVERNIRKAVDSAYEYDPDRIRSVFYYNVDKPYISEIISMAVESLKYGI